MTQRSGIVSNLLIAVLAGSLIIVTIITYLLYSNRLPPPQKQVPAPPPVQPGKFNSPQKSASAIGNLTLKGDKVYDGNSELFYNVSGVKSVRLGPDRHTIHFKVDPKNAWYSPSRCANLTAKIGPSPQDYGIPLPPQKAPWDYKQIGSAYTINSCTLWGGGLLQNSNQFAYLQINPQKEGLLAVENLDTSGKVVIKLPAEIMSGFFDNKDNSSTGSYGFLPIKFSQNGLAYLYPRHDTAVVNNRFLLSFGGLIVAVNTQGSGKFLGAGPIKNKDGDYLLNISYALLTNSGSPIVIRHFGWEGISSYVSLFDYSSDQLITLDISKVEQPGFDVFEMRKVEWKSDNVLIHLYKEDYAPQEDYKSFNDEIKDFNNNSQINTAEGKAEEFLKKKYNNQYVKCLFAPGLYGGCFTATNITTYKYVPGSGKLEKL